MAHMADVHLISTGGQSDENYDKVLVDIIKYVFHYEIESPVARERARVALLDALGCAIESLHTSPECENILGPIVPHTIVPNGFKLPGTSHQLDPAKGAFDMGAMIRYLDHNDAYPGAEWGHPSDNIGALLSVADWLSRCNISAGASDFANISNGDSAIASGPPMTMRTLFTAQIKAYEIQGCLQELNSFNAIGLDHTILVKIASTALTSWLLGLSESQALDALSQAFQDGHPLRTFRQSPNAGPRKGWAAGDACMRAVQLTLLTQLGQPGAPTVLTAPRWGFYATLFKGNEFILRREYTSWVMETVFFKLIPAEGHGISAVDAALQLVKTMADKGISAERDVEMVRIRTQGPAYTIINKTGALRNAADRDHCLQYIVAVVLLKGEVIETRDYSDSSTWASDERVDRLREKIEIVEDEQFSKDYKNPKKRSCSNALTIVLKSGVELDEVLVEFPIGHPGRPDTLQQVKSKFKKNMALAFEKDRIEEAMKLVEFDDLPVHEFVDLFYKG